ncbi:MAG: Lrp/AsnC family transcriptional regulator [Nanoarchaeota archaeon]|nr:Lrp/AsnC family transcriptional regulator [Nanoarchaeota archaeon]
MKHDDLQVLDELRKNARKSLTNISNNTRIPLSTVFKKVVKLEKNLINKYVSLIDFNKIGSGIRIHLVIKSKDRKDLHDFLIEHPNVNSLYRISQNFDFLVETIFPNMLEFENFMEDIENKTSNK